MGSDSKKARQLRTPARRGKIPWSYLCCVLAGMILVLVMSIVINHYRPATGPAPIQITANPSWGVMKKQTLMLERPPQAFQRQAPPEIQWVFGGYSPARLREFLQSSGLNARKLTLLLDEKLWQESNGNITVRPPFEIIREMNPASRQRIYDELARTPENLAQRYPFVFRGSFEDWFANCPLPAARIREVRRMVYKKDKVFYFADLSYFQITAPSNEVFLLARQITRVPTVQASLVVAQSSQLSGLKRYWLPSEEQADFDPLIVSLSRQPAEELNISALLPPLPRQLLYRYPQPSADIPRNADCVWTSMNFFNAQPDNRFVDEQFTSQTLQAQYRIVPKADALGDIIMLHKPSTNGLSTLIHMCVQIADDVVFTKNGGDIYQPWVLMHLEDVRALFSYEPVIDTTVFRRRGRGT
jgi:hypothetical protein